MRCLVPRTLRDEHLHVLQRLELEQEARLEDASELAAARAGEAGEAELAEVLAEELEAWREEQRHEASEFKARVAELEVAASEQRDWLSLFLEEQHAESLAAEHSESWHVELESAQEECEGVVTKLEAALAKEQTAASQRLTLEEQALEEHCLASQLETELAELDGRFREETSTAEAAARRTEALLEAVGGEGAEAYQQLEKERTARREADAERLLQHARAEELVARAETLRAEHQVEREECGREAELRRFADTELEVERGAVRKLTSATEWRAAEVLQAGRDREQQLFERANLMRSHIDEADCFRAAQQAAAEQMQWLDSKLRIAEGRTEQLDHALKFQSLKNEALEQEYGDRIPFAQVMKPRGKATSWGLPRVVGGASNSASVSLSGLRSDIVEKQRVIFDHMLKLGRGTEERLNEELTIDRAKIRSCEHELVMAKERHSHDGLHRATTQAVTRAAILGGVLVAARRGTLWLHKRGTQGNAAHLFEPHSGSFEGGTRVHWLGESNCQPREVYIDGRPCAALARGAFVVPCCARSVEEGSSEADVRIVHADGAETVHCGAFTYWIPGVFRCVVPCSGRLTGGSEIRVAVSDLGAPVVEVRIGSSTCELLGDLTATSATVKLPAAELEGAATVEVRAANGNWCASDSSVFSYFAPQAFGSVGNRVEVSAEGTVATRTSGVNYAVCLGAYPLRRFPAGRYFELVVETSAPSAKTFAVGVATRQEGHQGERLGGLADASALPRAWLCGYDAGGAKFCSDCEQSKLPPGAWRPVKEVVRCSRIGVLWEDATELGAPPRLLVFQDGRLRASLEARGRLPSCDEDLFALVDLTGGVSAVRLIEGSRPPAAASLGPALTSFDQADVGRVGLDLPPPPLAGVGPGPSAA